MIPIEVGNVWSRIIGGHAHTFTLKKYLQFQQRRWSAWHKRFEYDLINFYTQYGFPSGLLPYVLRKATGVVPIRLIDQRGSPPRHLKRAIDLALRDYQQEAVDAVLESKLGSWPWPRGAIEIGTGGGKTACIAQLAYIFPEPILILVSSKELLYQTQKELQRFINEPIGILGDGRYEPQRITIGMVQTLARNLPNPRLAAVRVLLVDEAHHLGAQTFIAVANACTNAYVRVGFSGTPMKDDNPVQMASLRGVTGDLLYILQARELINRGVVVPVTVTYHPVTQPTKIYHPVGESIHEFASKSLPYRPEYGRYGRERIITCPGAYDRLIVENLERNTLLATIAKSRTGTTLVLVNRIDHGKALAALIGCPFLSGQESTRDRLIHLQNMAQGTLPCLVATTIFDEGVNAPAIKHLILAGAGKAPWQMKQRIGRGMRKTFNDAPLDVIDTIDLIHPALARQSRNRIATARHAGFDIRMT